MNLLQNLLDYPKLNFETNANMHFFYPSIPLNLEDFDANVPPCTFNFLKLF
jgi:hypothetical protein